MWHAITLFAQTDPYLVIKNDGAKDVCVCFVL